MATHPSPPCAGCNAPLAPGARFCGSCGRGNGSGAVPPQPPQQPPQPPPAWQAAQTAGYDTVLLPGTPEQLVPRIALLLGQVGMINVQPGLGQIRFHYGAFFASRLTGEVSVRPDGAGNSAASYTVALDKIGFFLFGAAALVINLLFVTISPLLLLPSIAGFAWIYAYLSGGVRNKARSLVAQALQQAGAGSGAPPFGTPGAFGGAAPAYPPPVPPPASATPPISPTDRLRELAAQRDAGLLSEEEFARMKAAILGQLH